MDEKFKNSFNIFELAGAFGDIGILLPLAFAFVVFNGFSPQKLFLLWGAAYVLTGFYYKVPVAIQPLKAMAVIAIVSGFSSHQLASTAFFFGIILIIISVTGILRFLQPHFTVPIVRGIQVGIGLILIYKAVSLVMEKGLYLGWEKEKTFINLLVMSLVILVLWFFQFRKKFPLSIFLICGSILFSFLLGITIQTVPSLLQPAEGQKLLSAALPDFTFLLSSLVLLVLPQLPLTIGNAVFAASDISHQLWGQQAKRVNPTRLGFSIGILNVLIGLFGGFPICHGSGGMAAHHQFGARTGGATIIMGTLLILVATFTPLANFIFYIPIPLLGALLFITGLKMVYFVKSVKPAREIVTVLLVAAVSFLSKNLLIAVLVGFLLERTFYLFNGTAGNSNFSREDTQQATKKK
jgi:SulP family sulfate permease